MLAGTKKKFGQQVLRFTHRSIGNSSHPCQPGCHIRTKKLSEDYNTGLPYYSKEEYSYETFRKPKQRKAKSSYHFIKAKILFGLLSVSENRYQHRSFVKVKWHKANFAIVEETEPALVIDHLGTGFSYHSIKYLSPWKYSSQCLTTDFPGDINVQKFVFKRIRFPRV